MDINWNALYQAEDMAYFRGELCSYSPESYTIAEKREICNDMITSTKAILEAMRREFEGLPLDERHWLLNDLCSSGEATPQWWWDVLVGEGDPLYGELKQLS